MNAVRGTARAATPTTMRRHMLSGEAALLWAEKCGGLVQMADVTEVSPETARRILAMSPAHERTDLLDAIKTWVKDQVGG